MVARSIGDHFASAQVKSLFASADLQTFADFWAVDCPLVDKPNYQQGKDAWSSVGRFSIDSDGEVLCFYIKRQQDYFFRTLRHPLCGQLSFEREFQACQTLQKHHIACITPVYFAKRQINGHWQAILITADLAPLKEVDYYIQSNQFSTEEIRAMATFIKTLHDAKLRHGALYSKHIYYHPEHGFALIDLENVKRFVLKEKALKREFSRLLKPTGTIKGNVAKLFCQAYFQSRTTPSYIKNLLLKSS